MENKDRNRVMITATIHREVVRLLNKYYYDTCLKSRSRALENILLDYFFYMGYISQDEYDKIREDKTYAKY